MTDWTRFFYNKYLRFIRQIEAEGEMPEPVIMGQLTYWDEFAPLDWDELRRFFEKEDDE